jgi:alpha-L-arabinofuranosidase
VRSKPENLTYAKQLILLAVLLFSSSAFPQTQPVHATIDASKTSHPISKYIYGQFLEHAGNLVNEGVWAEMLADRKFYYPIFSQPPEEPPRPPWRRRGPLRHWTPMVADEFITMDSENPYTGDHSPLVKLDKTELHGFMQSGLAVQNGRAYTGRIVLAGSPTATVKVTLV